MSFLCRVSGLSLIDSIRSSAIWEGLSQPLHFNRRFGRLTRIPPSFSVLGMSHWEETSRQTQDTVEILNLLVSPGKTWWRWPEKGRSCTTTLDKWQEVERGVLELAFLFRAIAMTKGSTFKKLCDYIKTVS